MYWMKQNIYLCTYLKWQLTIYHAMAQPALLLRCPASRHRSQTALFHKSCQFAWLHSTLHTVADWYQKEGKMNMEKLQNAKNGYTKGTVCDVPFTELQ